jgi:hypothetical protein
VERGIARRIESHLRTPRPDVTGPVFARWALGAAALLFVAITAGVRLAGEGANAMAASDAAWSTRQGKSAAVHARAAARAFFPGTLHASRAHERLREVAAESEKSGDSATALFAWRALRSSYAAVRPYSGVTRESIMVADRAIERLARATCGGRLGPDGVRCRKEEETAKISELPPGLDWIALMFVGALLVVAAFTMLSVHGFGRDGRALPGPSRLAAFLGALGALAWFGGVYLL